MTQEITTTEIINALAKHGLHLNNETVEELRGVVQRAYNKGFSDGNCCKTGHYPIALIEGQEAIHNFHAEVENWEAGRETNDDWRDSTLFFSFVSKGDRALFIKGFEAGVGWLEGESYIDENYEKLMEAYNNRKSKE